MDNDSNGISSPSADNPSCLQRILFSLLIVSPAILIAGLISIYGFNLPYWDQWEEYDLFSHVQQHSLTFHDLVAQHNEHRIFFPRLLLITASVFAPYTDLVELWIIWILAGLSSLCLWGLSRQTGWSNAKGLLLLAGANVLLFNLLAWQDWLWGFQIGFLLPVFFVTAGIWSISVSQGSWQFFWAAFWSVVNSFTIASGFTTWVIFIPLLLFPNGKFNFRWKGLLLHLLGLRVCLFLYLEGYFRPPGSPTTSAVLADPLGALNYFFVYLGASLANNSSLPDLVVIRMSLVTGIVLFDLFIACVALLVFFHNQPRLIVRALPWLTLSLYALCSALITTFGRLGFGPGQALASRYVIFSSLLPIGLLFAGACLFPAFILRLRSQRIRQILGGLSLALPVISLTVYFWSAKTTMVNWQDSYRIRLQAKAALVFINLPAATPLLQSVAYPLIVPLRIYFDERSKLDCPEKVVVSSSISSLTDLSPPDPFSGLVEGLFQNPTTTIISGWAYLPKAHRAADLVLLTVQNEQNRDRIVGMVFPDGYEKSAAEKVQCRDDIPLKWSIDLPVGTNLRGLKAWSFDGLACRAYQIPEAAKPPDSH